MLRRDVFRALGTAGVAAFAGLSPDRLYAIGQDLHLRTGASLRALSRRESDLVAALADLIIPRTDTPGALDAGTVEFIDLLMAEWLSGTEAERLHEGLAAIDRAAVAALGRPFAELTHDRQVEVATALDAFTARAPRSAADAWYQVKRYTVYAYATSKPVMQDVIRYKVWPGRFDGCLVDEAALPAGPS